MHLRDGEGIAGRLTELRRMYEPYVVSLARYLSIQLPPWVRPIERPDNWQTSAWDRARRLPTAEAPVTRRPEDHF